MDSFYHHTLMCEEPVERHQMQSNHSRDKTNNKNRSSKRYFALEYYSNAIQTNWLCFLAFVIVLWLIFGSLFKTATYFNIFGLCFYTVSTGISLVFSISYKCRALTYYYTTICFMKYCKRSPREPTD